MVTPEEINLLWNEYSNNSSYPSPGDYGFAQSKTLLNKYPNAKIVDEKGGEGQGDYAHVVIDIDGQLFKTDGYYSSYDGFDWDGDWYEAVAVQISKTEYHKKKASSTATVEEDSWDDPDSWD